jgi:hypothetical protein
MIVDIRLILPQIADPRLFNALLNDSMVNAKSTVDHHFLHIPIAQRIAQIPFYTQQYNLSFKMAPLKRVLLGHTMLLPLRCERVCSLSENSIFCNRTVSSTIGIRKSRFNTFLRYIVPLCSMVWVRLPQLCNLKLLFHQFEDILEHERGLKHFDAN